MIELLNRRDAVELLEDFRQLTGVNLPPIRCWDCDYYNKGRCAAYNADIPFHVMRDGCEKFEAFVPF